MKINIMEHEGCFGIDITAENMADAAMLIRLARDSTKAPHHFSTTPYRDGTFMTYITFEKRKRSRATINQGESNGR